MTDFSDIAICCICMEEMKDPRILPCIHTFCLKCLQKTGEHAHTRQRDELPCPLCRKEFTISSGGFGALQKNLFIQRLVDLRKISKPVDRSNLCDVCKINSVDLLAEAIPSAAMYCIDCKDNLCEACCKEHSRQKFSRNHEIVPFGSEIKEELVDKHETSFCEQHSKKPLEIYCVDCKIVVCVLCFVESHKLHDCKDVEKVAENFRRDINKSFDKMSECETKASNKMQQLIKANDNILQEAINLETEIVKQGKELKELVDQQIKSLVEELAAIRGKSLKEAQTEIEEIERYLVMTESFKMYCNALKSRGSPSDVCRGVMGLEERANELQKLNEVEVQREVPKKIYRFVPTDQTQMIVGRIEELTRLSVEFPMPIMDISFPSFGNVAEERSRTKKLSQLDIQSHEKMKNRTLKRVLEVDPTRLQIWVKWGERTQSVIVYNASISTIGLSYRLIKTNRKENKKMC